MAKLIKIKSYKTKVEAEMVKEFLERNGVQAMTVPEPTTITCYSIPDGPTELHVKEEDNQKASSMLEKDKK